MSKVITSPVRKWPGTVTLADPLTFPQFMAWRKAMTNAKELMDEKDVSPMDEAVLPGICACVEEWHLNGQTQYTPETFPATPRRASNKLVAWLVDEISSLVTEAEEIPNA